MKGKDGNLADVPAAMGMALFIACVDNTEAADPVSWSHICVRVSFALPLAGKSPAGPVEAVTLLCPVGV